MLQCRSRLEGEQSKRHVDASQLNNYRKAGSVHTVLYIPQFKQTPLMNRAVSPFNNASLTFGLQRR